MAIPAQQNQRTREFGVSLLRETCPGQEHRTQRTARRIAKERDLGRQSETGGTETEFISRKLIKSG